MRQLIHKINLALGLFWAISTGYSYADEEATLCSESTCCCTCPPPSGHGFIGAELLYWRAFQDGLDMCSPSHVSNTVLPDGRLISTSKGRGRDPHFEWNPGFRIGADYEFPCSQWDVGVFWTHFNSEAHRSLSASNRLRWHVNLDVIDFLVSYQCNSNSCFSLIPYLGLRFARIDQKLRVGQFPDSSTFAKAGEHLSGKDNKQMFNGIGPLFGLEVDLELTCNFSLYVNGAVSWLYGNNDVRLTNSLATSDVINFCNVKNNTNSMCWVADAAFGIQWETCFCTDKQLFLQLGYEHHQYFDYSRFGKCGDLSFDGLSFGVGIGF